LFGEEIAAVSYSIFLWIKLWLSKWRVLH